MKKRALKQGIEKKRFIGQETCRNRAAIEQYLMSTQRKELLQYVASFDESIQLNKCKYSEIRAVLIGEIILRNAQRTGVVCGMRVSEVANGERVGEIKYKVVVFEHKTGKSKPAVIFFDKLATNALLYYKENILPQISKSCTFEDYFFLSFDGKPIDQQTVQKSITQLLTLAGIDRKVTPTQSRIAAATYIATTTPEKTQLVADYMGHQANTAEKYYRQIGGGGHLMDAYDAIGPHEDEIDQNDD